MQPKIPSFFKGVVVEPSLLHGVGLIVSNSGKTEKFHFSGPLGWEYRTDD